MCSKAVALLLFIYCLLLFPLIVFLFVWSVLVFNTLLSVLAVSLPHGTMGWLAICEFGISSGSAFFIQWQQAAESAILINFT